MKRKRPNSMPIKPGEIDAFRNLFDEWQEALKRGLNAIEAHPHWREKTVLELMRCGVPRLRSFIERKGAATSKIRPIIEMRYAFDWNWEAWDKRDYDDGGVTAATLTSDSFLDRKTFEDS